MARVIISRLPFAIFVLSLALNVSLGRKVHSQRLRIGYLETDRPMEGQTAPPLVVKDLAGRKTVISYTDTPFPRRCMCLRRVVRGVPEI